MYFVFIFCLCTLTIAAVLPREKDATILNYDFKNNGRGNYHFSYVTSNGIKRTETGRLVNADQDNEYTVVEGFYEYIDSNGKSRSFLYIADENGYHVNFDSQESTTAEENDAEGDIVISEIPHVISSLLGR